MLGMSGIIFGSLSLLLSLLFLFHSPHSLAQILALNFPLVDFQKSFSGIPPPLPFAVPAVIVSMCAYDTRVGQMAISVSLLAWLAIFTLFIW